jgi:hypothetical protein
MLASCARGGHHRRHAEPADEPKPTLAGDKNFFPRGAIFFFVLLLLFYTALWFLICGIMIVRR